MNQTTLNDYLSKFEQYINREIDILTKKDAETGKNIFVPFTVIGLGLLSSTIENGDNKVFEQYVELRDNATGKETKRTIRQVVDYFEHPNKGKKGRNHL